MDNILKRFGSLPEPRKIKILEIQDSIDLSPEYILNLGEKELTALTETLNAAVHLLKNSPSDINSFRTKSQPILDKLSELTYSLENYVFAIEFFLRGKKSKDLYAKYNALSISEKFQFRNQQMLIDLLEEKSVALLRSSIIAAQSKMQLIMDNDEFTSLVKGL